jgi:hypothetical protein
MNLTQASQWAAVFAALAALAVYGRFKGRAERIQRRREIEARYKDSRQEEMFDSEQQQRKERREVAVAR